MVQVYYREQSSCAPSASQDVYIFSIAPVANESLAAITSADELLLISKDLTGRGASSLKGVPRGLTGLATADAGNTVICSSSEGVGFFDLRTQTRTGHFSLGTHLLLSFFYVRPDKCSDRPVNALACKGDDVAVGGEAIVAVW